MASFIAFLPCSNDDANMDFSKLTATEIITHIAASNFSAVTCTQHFIDEIKSRDDSINSFLSISDESALESATRIDQQRSAGKPLPPLAGLPIAIKDGICTAGQRTSAGSHMLEGFVPPFHATAVQRLIADGKVSCNACRFARPVNASGVAWRSNFFSSPMLSAMTRLWLRTRSDKTTNRFFENSCDASIISHSKLW